MMLSRTNRGVTLIEVMIVVSIIGILSGIAAWTAHRLFPKYRSKAAAMEFAKYVDMCRMYAIRTNRECRVAILDWDSSPASLGSNTGKYSISLGDASVNSTTWDVLPEDTFSDASDDQQHHGIIDLSTGQHIQHGVTRIYNRRHLWSWTGLRILWYSAPKISSIRIQILTPKAILKSLSPAKLL